MIEIVSNIVASLILATFAGLLTWGLGAPAWAIFAVAWITYFTALPMKRQEDSLRPIVEHVAGLIAPETGEEYGLIHRQLIYDAQKALHR